VADLTTYVNWRRTGGVGVAILRTPSDGTVKVIERGTGIPVVFLHSGVGSAGEWREVFSRWPDGYRLIAVDAYSEGDGPGSPGHRTLADYSDQVHAVVNHVGQPVHLVGFSWGGATGLHVALTAPEALASLTVVEPEAYSLLRTEDARAFAEIAGLRDRWREHVDADRWYEAFEEFIDFYNGPGSFARWPSDRRERFLEAQRARGDLWDVLFDAPLTPEALSALAVPVRVIEGSATSAVDHAICGVLLRRVPRVEHVIIDGAGHMMPLTHAAELAQAVAASIPAPGSSRADLSRPPGPVGEPATPALQGS
jgi:lipase